MMRLWANRYARSAFAAAIASGALSVVVHTGVIAAWAYATRPDADVPSTSMEDHAYFIPPPDRQVGSLEVREAVRYFDLAQQGIGDGDGARTMGDLRPRTGDERIGRAHADSANSSDVPTVLASGGTQDSVFSVLEVDSAVVRSASSAAPVYPLDLLAAHVVGYVAARYVVDTTGFADIASFSVIKATNPQFVVAVRDALPYMRFRPAKIGAQKVRQLVEQQFSFRIDSSVHSAKAPPTTVAEPPRS
jgi:hypothetical protein